MAKIPKSKSVKIQTVHLTEVSVLTSDGTEVLTGIFHDKASEPVGLRFMGIEADDEFIPLPLTKTAAAETPALLDDPGIKTFSLYWQKGMEVKQSAMKVQLREAKGSSLADKRKRSLSRILYHIYLASKKVETLPAKPLKPLIQLGLARLRREGVALAADEEPNGCTMSPDGWWKECCDEHDRDYERGGSEDDRLEADEKLYDCMVDNDVPRFVAYTYYLAVRAFGASHFNYHD